jgi:hypothetical protein
MAYEEFKEWHPQKPTLKRLELVQEIINHYKTLGLLLTVRQIHYQLVSTNAYANTQSNYDSLTRMITNARMSGRLDWSAIVDRNRETKRSYFNDSVKDAIRSALTCFGRDKMLYQDVYIEVMIEKMAIFEIVSRVTNKYNIMLTGDKGFCSTTVLYEIAGRMKEQTMLGKKCYVLYIGDHDPSGLTMDESIKNTLARMGANGVNFIRVGLTKEQVEEYNLPPNVIKENNTNAKKYSEKHGDISWECDALPPEILQNDLEDSILSLINYSTYEFMCKLEKEGKEQLTNIINKLDTQGVY